MVLKYLDGVLLRLLVSSAMDHGLNAGCKSKDYAFDIGCLLVKHTVLRNKIKC